LVEISGQLQLQVSLVVNGTEAVEAEDEKGKPQASARRCGCCYASREEAVRALRRGRGGCCAARRCGHQREPA